VLTRKDFNKAALRLYDFCEYPAVRYKPLFHLLDKPYDDQKLTELRPAFLASDIVEELYREQDSCGGWRSWNRRSRRINKDIYNTVFDRNKTDPL